MGKITWCVNTRAEILFPGFTKKGQTYLLNVLSPPNVHHDTGAQTFRSSLHAHTHTHWKKAGPGGEHGWQSNIKNKQKPYAFPQTEFGNKLKEWFQKVKIVDN